MWKSLSQKKPSMKKTLLILAFAIVVLTMALSSCKQTNEARLASLENSIERLENNYREMTEKEWETAVIAIDEQIEQFDELKDKGVLTKDQRQKLFELKARYVKVKVLVALPLNIEGNQGVYDE